MNKHLYILVADSGRAKIYRAQTPLQTLETVSDQVNFQGRKKNSEIYSDRPGRQQSDFGGSHSFGGERATHEDEKFSRELCRYLCDEHKAGRFDTLVMIAPPRFLGELRKHLHAECREVLLNTIAKDLVRMDESNVIEHVIGENPELSRSAK